MAVIIKDMKMPKRCAECDIEVSSENPYGDVELNYCPLIYKGYTDDCREHERMKDCPLDEVVTCGECKYVQLSLRDEVKYCDVFFPDKPHRLPKDHFCGLGEKE